MIEKKAFNFELKKISKDETKEKGYFSGFASTPDLDLNRDVVNPVAFVDWLERLKSRSKKNKKLKILFNHDENKVIGGVLINNIKVSEKGLEIKDAELILTVPQARDVYELMKHDILDSMSIGFRTLDSIKKSDGEREITEMDVAEISVVTMPSNREALIKEVKKVSSFKNFPLAERNEKWDSSEAVKRIRKFLKSEDEPNSKYKEAFFYYDPKEEENFGAYKLPFVDVVDGKLKAIPRAIIACAAVMDGARGGIKDVSEADRKKIKDNIDKYYKKMDMESPFGEEKEDEDYENANLYEGDSEDMEDEERKFKKPLPGNDKRNMATKRIDKEEMEDYPNELDEEREYEEYNRRIKDKKRRMKMEDGNEVEAEEEFEDYNQRVKDKKRRTKMSNEVGELEAEKEFEDSNSRIKDRRKARKMSRKDVYEGEDYERENNDRIDDDDYDDEDEYPMSFRKLATFKDIRKSLKKYGIGSEKAKDLMSSVINTHKSMVEKRRKSIEDDADNDLINIDKYVLPDDEDEVEDETLEMGMKERTLKKKIDHLMKRIERLDEKCDC